MFWNPALSAAIHKYMIDIDYISRIMQSVRALLCFCGLALNDLTLYFGVASY